MLVLAAEDVCEAVSTPSPPASAAGVAAAAARSLCRLLDDDVSSTGAVIGRAASLDSTKTISSYKGLRQACWSSCNSIAVAASLRVGVMVL